MREINFTKLANFQPKQLEAFKRLFQPECKYLLYGGAAAGGKSYFVRWSALALGMYYSAKYGIKGIPIGLFSEDYPTLKDRQISRIKREFPPWLGELKDTREEGYVFKASDKWGGFNILLRNLDDPSKYASVEFAAILVEELTKNNEETFDDLRFRLRYPGIPDTKFVGATNPGSIGHGWVKQKWIAPNSDKLDHEQSRFFYVPARYDDNKYIDPSYVEQLRSLPEKKRKAFMEGSWTTFEDQYFEEWNEGLHIIRPFIPQEGSLVVGGMDWGRTAPFSFHLTTIEKVFFNATHFYRAKTFFETYGTQKNPKEWSQEIQTQLKLFNLTLKDVSWVRADPTIFNKGQDMSKSIRDQFVDDNELWRLLRSANNDRVAGWSVMHNWLSNAPDELPYWQITRNCTNLIRTLPDQVYDKNNVEDIDSDGEDHACDDQRYQFKHLKWIDAKVGAISKSDKPTLPYAHPAARMIDGNQLPINIDKFVPKR